LEKLTKSEAETIRLGQDFGAKSSGGEVFLLSGDLGGGKTQFVKGLALGLGITEYITSPTFTYEKIYQGEVGLSLYHFDLYREDQVSEDVLGMINDALSDKKGICAVEWSERAPQNTWPKNSTHIFFKWEGDHERRIEFD
jgi:tRNA threonylcarbamoyladenosine biosynthesis protein TsaE